MSLPPKMTPPFKTHKMLNTAHGFFGREGGVSEGVYGSLNASAGSSDTPEHVAENRARISAALGAEALISLAQIHSDKVEIITQPPIERLKADGLVTTTPRLAISVLSADCGPVLLHDGQAGVIGACHAGWRGALSGIIENTVAAMCEMGASPANMTAILGPCISLPNYEVGEAFKSAFTDINEDYAQYFRDSAAGVAHFDLPAFALSRLAASGVGGFAWTGDCTYGAPNAYFSYRRNTHEGLSGYGRNLSAIMLP